jgi:hypothetical protein
MVTQPEVVNHGRLIQISQISHVLDLVELGWIHLSCEVDVDCPDLQPHSDIETRFINRNNR